MSLQSVAHPDIAKVHAMLSKMDGPQLQKFAAAHQDNAIYVSLAMQVDKDRKEQMQRLQALMTGQEQPKVIPQAVAALNPQGMAPPGMGAQQQGGAPMPPPGGPQGQMPPQGMPPQGPPGMQMPPQAPPAPQGVASLPAPNMEGMADGGIAGYADEDEAVGYADGGVVHMQAGGLTEAEIRAQGRSLGTPQPLIELAVQNARMAAENAQQQRQLPFTPAMPSAVAKDNTVVRDTTSMFRDPGYDVFKNPPTIRQLYGDQPTLGTAADAIEKMTRENAAKDLFARPGMQQFVADLGAGRVRPSAEEPGKILPMTPGQGALNVPTAEQVSAALAAQKTPTQTYADLYKAVGAGNAPAASRGAGLASLARAGGPPTLTPPSPLTAEKAMENVGQFFDPKELYAQADRARAEALGRAEETAQFVKLNKPAAPFKKLAEKLDTEEFAEAGEKQKARGMAIMMAGLKMMESPYGGKGLGSFLRNVGAGATEGAKELQKSNKEFKELAQKRMQLRVTIEATQDAAARGDFDREIALRTRADSIEDSANNNKMRIGEALFNAKGNAALTAFNHAENVANQFKLAEFGAQSEAYNNERRIAAQAANTQATIAAQRQSDLFKAQLPPESLRAAAILGGARPGETGTPEQIKAGLTLINSEKFNPQTAYSKYVTDWKKDPVNPNDRMMTYPEYLAMFGAGKVVDKLPANALVRNPQ